MGGADSKLVRSAMAKVTSGKDDQAKDFIEKVKDSKETFNRVNEKFYTQYKIDGKTMPEWREHFYVKVEKDAHPSRCKALLAELSEKHQEASFYYSRAGALEKAYGSEREKAYRERYRETTDARTGKDGKAPASTTLQTIASNAVQEYDDVIYNAQIVKDFWKGIIEQLKYSYKLINDITINNGYEIKMSPPPH